MLWVLSPTRYPSSADSLKTTAQAWVTNFKAVTTNLQKMAENQLTGTAHSAELLAFINDAVKWDVQNMCGGTYYTNLLRMVPQALHESSRWY